jgi:hypothetical protein
MYRDTNPSVLPPHPTEEDRNKMTSRFKRSASKAFLEEVSQSLLAKHKIKK